MVAAVALHAIPASPVRAAGFQAALSVSELGHDSGLRIRVFHDPDFMPTPGAAGHLFLVAADSARGADAFFIPTDLALEFGNSQIYRVEFEQASDLLGQALGGRLRPGEVQLGFVMVPAAVDRDRYLPDHPDSVVIRYANRRASFRPVTGEERAEWEAAVERPILAAGLNFWWQWVSTINEAPAMSEGERRFFAERVFPAQGHVLQEESVSTESLRNAILRVGERRLLESRSVQRVAPAYPAAARQAGIGGLVVVLAYIQADGAVGDALILASSTVHLLNLAALTAAMDWRFARSEDGAGNPVDGWRLIPLQFRIAGAAGEGGPAAVPRIVRRGPLDYPFEAKRQKIKGTVVYRVRVDERGKLVEAVLEQGVHPLIDQAALVAVEKTRFLPATRNGEPVPGEILMSFEFKEELD